MDHRQTDDDKQVGHLADRHGIGTVTHDAEDAEQSETDAHRGLAALHTHHAVDEEVDGDGHQHEREVEVTTVTLLIIETVDNDKVDDNAGEEFQERLQEFCGKEC